MPSNMQRQRSGGANQPTPTQRNSESSQPPSVQGYNAGPSGYVRFGDYGTSEPAPSHSNRRPDSSDPYGSFVTSEPFPSQSNRRPNPWESYRISEPVPAQSNGAMVHEQDYRQRALTRISIEGPSRHWDYAPPPGHPPPSIPINGTSQSTPSGSNTMMISRTEQPPDPRIRTLRDRYVDTVTTPLIREIVEKTIHDIPHVLIDVASGRLCDKTQQAAAFEETPIFNELRSSMTRHDQLDRQRIQGDVERFYKYVMLSHKWQLSEPTFQMVKNVSIYGLPKSPTNNKLIDFCRLVLSLNFRWAWSDTCCVDQTDKGVQQEAIFAMFRWYCHATLTIVHLLGVLSGSQRKGSLLNSVWNTRGWTYQEYVASKVVQFYTEDWKPLFGLDIFNHKDSPAIRSEMEHALTTLQSGLDMVRKKLYLASKRETMKEEDIAYSLFGIFNVAIPVMYGEGNQAIGRLLEHILTRSANVTILAWTGISGSYHSCLPANLTVYSQIPPPHVPQPIEAAAMSRMVMELQSSLPDPSLIDRLYERLDGLPSLSLVSGRLKLPGFVFPVTGLTALSGPEPSSGLYLYRAKTSFFSDVLIETKDSSLRKQRHLVLVHPWVAALIDEDFSGGLPLSNLHTRACRLIARLSQPFGALLLASQGRVLYKRVATDSFIKIQIRALETPLEELISRIQTVDVQ